MKKSEKLKGKEAIAARKIQRTQYVIAGGAVICILLVIGFFLFNPFVAKNGDTVMVYYTGTFENGTVFDSNIGGNPLAFTLGHHAVITGLEEAVIGMAPDTTKTVNISYDKAYGPYRQDLIQVLNRSELPDNIDPVVGQMYSIRRTTDGAVAYVRLVGFNESSLTVDQNHLLAGENLTFAVQFIGFAKK